MTTDTDTKVNDRNKMMISKRNKEHKQKQLKCTTKASKIKLKEEMTLTVRNQRKKSHNDLIAYDQPPKTEIDSGRIVRREKSISQEIHKEESSKVVVASHRPMEKRPKQKESMIPDTDNKVNDRNKMKKPKLNDEMAEETKPYELTAKRIMPTTRAPDNSNTRATEGSKDGKSVPRKFTKQYQLIGTD